MDFVIELITEVLFEVYGELMLLIVPEKGGSRGFRLASKIIAVAVMLGVLALFIIGVVMLTEQNRPVGIILISAGGMISLIQITLGIILYKKNH